VTEGRQDPEVPRAGPGKPARDQDVSLDEVALVRVRGLLVVVTLLLPHGLGYPSVPFISYVCREKQVTPYNVFREKEVTNTRNVHTSQRSKVC
jgi:hypothetical protein